MSRATVNRSPFPSELSKEPMIVVDERSEQGDAPYKIHIYMSARGILRTHKFEQLNCHSWPPSGAARVGSWLALANSKMGLKRDTICRTAPSPSRIHSVRRCGRLVVVVAQLSKRRGSSRIREAGSRTEPEENSFNLGETLEELPCDTAGARTQRFFSQQAE